jgi:hypothetical protein
MWSWDSFQSISSWFVGVMLLIAPIFLPILIITHFGISLLKRMERISDDTLLQSPFSEIDEFVGKYLTKYVIRPSATPRHQITPTYLRVANLPLSEITVLVAKTVLGLLALLVIPGLVFMHWGQWKLFGKCILLICVGFFVYRITTRYRSSLYLAAPIKAHVLAYLSVLFFCSYIFDMSFAIFSGLYGKSIGTSWLIFVCIALPSVLVSEYRRTIPTKERDSVALAVLLIGSFFVGGIATFLFPAPDPWNASLRLSSLLLGVVFGWGYSFLRQDSISSDTEIVIPASDSSRSPHFFFILLRMISRRSHSVLNALLNQFGIRVDESRILQGSRLPLLYSLRYKHPLVTRFLFWLYQKVYPYGIFGTRTHEETEEYLKVWLCVLSDAKQYERVINVANNKDGTFGRTPREVSSTVWLLEVLALIHLGRLTEAQHRLDTYVSDKTGLFFLYVQAYLFWQRGTDEYLGKGVLLLREVLARAENQGNKLSSIQKVVTLRLLAQILCEQILRNPYSKERYEANNISLAQEALLRASTLLQSSRSRHHRLLLLSTEGVLYLCQGKPEAAAKNFFRCANQRKQKGALFRLAVLSMIGTETFDQAYYQLCRLRSTYEKENSKDYQYEGIFLQVIKRNIERIETAKKENKMFNSRLIEHYEDIDINNPLLPPDAIVEIKAENEAKIRAEQKERDKIMNGGILIDWLPPA